MRVLGVGDNVVDKYDHIKTMFPGGNALNFAAYAKMMGFDSAYLGIFGNDAAALHVQNTAKELQIALDHCQTVVGENGAAYLKIENGERIFLGSNEGGIRKTTSMSFIRNYVDYLKSFDLIHSGCYSYMENELEFIKSLGKPFSYDFSDDFVFEETLKYCKFVDFAFYSCAEYSLEETKNFIQKAYEAGAKLVCATRGTEGAILFDGDKWYTQKPSLVEPVDTMGAGDAFITSFTCNMVASKNFTGNYNIQESLQKAADFAASICKLPGAFGHGATYE